LATLCIVAAGFVFSVALNWPGHLSYDSVVQLLEGRTARYGNWHPPVMSWLLGALDAVIPGTGLFVVVEAALLFGALGLSAILPRKPSWLQAAIVAAAIFTPQWILYPGIVWKDVLFAASVSFAFVCIALAAERWSELRERTVLLLVATLLLVLGALARQNGIVVLPIAAAALGWIAWQIGGRAKILNTIFWGVGFFTVLLLVTASAWFALQTRVVGQTGPAGQFRLLDTYDLAGAIHDDPKLELAILDDDDEVLEAQMRGDAARLYTPQRNDTLASSRTLQAALRRADDSTIPSQWWAFVRARPGLYLKVRWDAFRWVLFTPESLACRPIFAGVTGPPQVLEALGMKGRFDARDGVLMAYGATFAGTPVLSHALYLAIASASLLILLRRRRAPDIAVVAMLASALLFTLSFFVISIACDYRYLYFVDMSAVLALVYLAPDLPEELSRTVAMLRRKIPARK
jgi:hypothetical protein